MSDKYPECESCVFRNRAPEVCENCEDADQYVEDEQRDEEGIRELSRMTFIPRNQEIVSDIDEGLEFLIERSTFE